MTTVDGRAKSLDQSLHKVKNAIASGFRERQQQSHFTHKRPVISDLRGEPAADVAGSTRHSQSML